MIDHTWYIRPEGIPERLAAGGVVVRRDGTGRLHIAFARKQSRPNHVLPKGGVDDGETELDAARREIAEEIGITSLTFLADLGVRERLSGNKKRWTRCRYFLFLTDQQDGKPSDTKRHYVGPVWFPLDNLPPLFWPEQQDLIESNRDRIGELSH